MPGSSIAKMTVHPCGMFENQGRGGDRRLHGSADIQHVRGQGQGLTRAGVVDVSQAPVDAVRDRGIAPSPPRTLARVIR